MLHLPTFHEIIFPCINFADHIKVLRNDLYCTLDNVSEVVRKSEIAYAAAEVDPLLRCKDAALNCRFYLRCAKVGAAMS